MSDVVAMTSFFCDLAPQLGCWLAARQMHIVMLRAVMRAPLTFFDTTPIGRIISRFAKDVDVLDTSLPPQISDTIYCLFEVIVLEAHGENSSWDSLYHFLAPYISYSYSTCEFHAHPPSFFHAVNRESDRTFAYMYLRLKSNTSNFFHAKRVVQTDGVGILYWIYIYVCVIILLVTLSDQ